MACGKIHHYLNISNCLSVKIPARTKTYIYYNSIVPRALWQRRKWIFTYDKKKLLKWKVYSGKTAIHMNGFKLYIKISFSPWPKAGAGRCYYHVLKSNCCLSKNTFACDINHYRVNIVAFVYRMYFSWSIWLEKVYLSHHRYSLKNNKNNVMGPN